MGDYTPDGSSLVFDVPEYSDVRDGPSMLKAFADSIAPAIDGKVSITPTQNAQSSGDYVFTSGDVSAIVIAGDDDPATFTIPPQASVAWPARAILCVVSASDDAVTIAPGSGVTFMNGSSVVLSKGESANAIRTGVDEWLVTKGGGGLPKAVVSGGTESTLTNPDGDGKNHKLCAFTGNGTLTVSREGYVWALVVGRGAAGYNGKKGSGGRVVEVKALWLEAGTYAVTVPAGATNQNGAAASLGTVLVAAPVHMSPDDGSGAGATVAGSSTGHTSTITGSSVTYARATGTSTYPGDGGPNSGSVVGGVVYVRAEL